MASHFDRRQFARAASASVALFAIPGWFAACARRGGFGIDPSGRPTLVFRVPADEDERWKIGEFLGLFLLHGTEEQRAWLAGCELACATTAELGRCGLELGGVHAVLFVPGEDPVAAIAGRFPFEDLYQELDGSGARRVEPRKKDERFLARFPVNNDWIAAQLANVLGPGSPAFERCSAREREQVGDLAPGTSPNFERALSAPFLARVAAANDPTHRAEWHHLLASIVRERWAGQSPKGSTWANSSGCGVSYEKPLPSMESGMYACGMGHVPELAARFLYLYSEDELRSR